MEKKERELELKEKILEKGAGELAEIFSDFRLEVRAEIDELELKIKILEACIRELHPEAEELLPKLHEKVYQQVNPESES